MRDQTIGLLFTASAAVLFGTLGIFGRSAVGLDVSVTTLLTSRCVLATAVFWCVLVLQDRVTGLPRRIVGLELGLGAVYGIMSIAYFESLAWLPAGVAALLLFTYPVQVTVASSLLLDEPITSAKVVALLAASSGVVLVVVGDAVVVAGAGILLVAIASVCYTVYTMGTRAMLEDVDPLVHVAHVFLGVTITILAYGGVTGELAVPGSPASWLLIGGVTVVGTVVPLALFTAGLARIEASRASIISTSEPLTTVLLGVTLLGEVLTISVGVGALLIIAGVACTSARAERLIRSRLVGVRVGVTTEHGT